MSTHTAVVEKNTPGVGWYILALVIPIAGFFAGIFWLAKSQVGPGFALFATSFVGWILAIAVLFA